MKRRGHGGLLLVAATVGWLGVSFAAAYAAAKGYALSLGEARHVEFQKVGVHVSILAIPAGSSLIVC